MSLTGTWWICCGGPVEKESVFIVSTGVSLHNELTRAASLLKFMAQHANIPFLALD